MKYSACLEMLFTDSPIEKAIKRAKECGFDCVEFWTWKDKDLDAIEKAAKENKIEISIFQGNIDGNMVDPLDNNVYVDGVKTTIKLAKRLGAKHLFLMANAMNPDRTIKKPANPMTDEQMLDNMKTVLMRLKPIAEENDIMLVLEPLNTLQGYRHSYNVCEGYFLNHMAPAVKIIREVNSPKIKVLYDFYQMGVMEGNIINTLRNSSDAIGYIHIGDVPERYQPGTGELNYPNIFKTLRKVGYNGNVGFEFECVGSSGEEVIKDVIKLLS
jgi:hydroxypyruvate isomerase